MRNATRVDGVLRPQFLPNERSSLTSARLSFPPWAVVLRAACSCGADVVEECYLVDPASSHMLVSKIKPCMCKYELIQTVKLRMAH